MDLKQENYDPNAFICWLIDDVFKVKNDAALARVLDVSHVTISKVRHRVLPVPSHVVIAVHEETGMRTLDIKARMFRQAEPA